MQKIVAGIRMAKKLTGHHNLLNKQSVDRACEKTRVFSCVLKMIEEYIVYYNNKRLQRKLGVVTPMEKYTNYLKAA